MSIRSLESRIKTSISIQKKWKEDLEYRNKVIKRIRESCKIRVTSITHREILRKRMLNNKLGVGNTNTKGKHLSEEHKINISNSLKGRKFTKEWISKISLGQKGQRHSKSTEFKIGHKGLIGNESPNWKGGISFEPYSLDWKKSLKRDIRKRDMFTCQICNKNQVELNKTLDIHHIDYNKKNCSQENLISLCHKCHLKTNVKNNEYYKNLFSLMLKYNFFIDLQRMVCQ